MESSRNKIIILGGGIVGLTIAYRLIERNISSKIIILEKEKEIGLHTSGRNSGVLHSGIYYRPNTIKAKVCSQGSKRMRNWIEKRKLSLKDCGKVIVPSNLEEDKMLDTLYERGVKNGCEVELWNERKLTKFMPEAYSASGRALWSPKTCVVNPKEVLNQLEKELISMGVEIIKDAKIQRINLVQNSIETTNNLNLYFDYVFNATGLQSDRVSKLFNIDHPYKLLPFKGLYWKLTKNCPIQIKANLYPVPDLNVPFLGVHFTPNTQGLVSIGPTATPAWGRENYNGFEKIEAIMALENLNILIKQYISDKNKFREYVHKQAFQAIRPFLVNAAKKLVPKIRSEHIEFSHKVGIRAQLFNLKEMNLVDDFVSINSKNSTHILNSISPAFTSSFELADLIIDKSNLR